MMYGQIDANDGGVKLGDQVARKLEQAIAMRRLDAGAFIGSERDLAEHYGVSRSTIREAVAIGEWQGFLESRRGREGGLYVASGIAIDAVPALRNFLFLAGARLRPLLDARRLIDGLMLDLAIERIAPEQIGQFMAMLTGSTAGDAREQLARLLEFVRVMTRAADFPALGVLSAALRHCFVDRARTCQLDDQAFLEASRGVAALRRKQVEAIVSCDREAARALHGRAFDIWQGFADATDEHGEVGAGLIDRLCDNGPDALIYEFVDPVKKTEAIARIIAQKILSQRLGPGDRLGIESDIVRELAISRRAFREAVRILERFGVVETGRGKNGGLSVGRARHDALLRVTDRGLGAVSGAREGDYPVLVRLILVEAARTIAGQVADGDADAQSRLAAGGQAWPEADGLDDGRQAIRRMADVLVPNCRNVVWRTLVAVVASACPPRACDAALGGANAATALDAIARGDSLMAPRHMAAFVSVSLAGQSQ